MIIYDGPEKQIKQQKKCKHNWHGPCMDDISRYYICVSCYCLDRDCRNKKDYQRLVKETSE